MNRRWVWVNIILTGIAYQMLRELSGLRAEPEPILEAAYWSGAALTYHWLSFKWKEWGWI